MQQPKSNEMYFRIVSITSRISNRQWPLSGIVKQTIDTTEKAPKEEIGASDRLFSGALILAGSASLANYFPQTAGT